MTIIASSFDLSKSDSWVWERPPLNLRAICQSARSVRKDIRPVSYLEEAEIFRRPKVLRNEGRIIINR
jgi:hypothetical protein